MVTAVFFKEKRGEHARGKGKQDGKKRILPSMQKNNTTIGLERCNLVLTRKQGKGTKPLAFFCATMRWILKRLDGRTDYRLVYELLCALEKKKTVKPPAIPPWKKGKGACRPREKVERSSGSSASKGKQSDVGRIVTKLHGMGGGRAAKGSSCRPGVDPTKKSTKLLQNR